MRNNNLLKGQLAEKKALQFLKDKNYQIIHSNWRCRLGEVDIIAQDGSYLCFIEVKYRKSNSYGLPREAVDHKKRQKLINLALYYISREEKEKNIRFDVVEVSEDSINIIRNAFTADQ
ncbi:YraN family protein [Elusimicrobiota bacterium]